MKFQFLGTAAAEAVPAIFCTCENCKKSRAIGGRAIRTRSQAIIDDVLLIDFPADTYVHTVVNHVDLSKVKHCLITHTHWDHLYPAEVNNLRKGFSRVPDDYHLTFYGSRAVGDALSGTIAFVNEKMPRISFVELKPFEVVDAGGYTVTALPATHAPATGPLFYQVEKEGKTVLYAHDTHYFDEVVWNYFAETKPFFSVVSLDCTNACTPLTYVGHMSLEENIKVKERMIAEGYADENTVFVCNHFSHGGINSVYDEFVPIAGKEGFLVSYDGMTVTL